MDQISSKKLFFARYRYRKTNTAYAEHFLNPHQSHIAKCSLKYRNIRVNQSRFPIRCILSSFTASCMDTALCQTV